jgi:hypothetical protein
MLDSSTTAKLGLYLVFQQTNWSFKECNLDKQTSFFKYCYQFWELAITNRAREKAIEER